MKKPTGTRGFTLVELSIVMALVAILAVMIVSFTSLTSLRVKQASARADFMDDVADYRIAVIDGFAEIDANSTFDVSVENGRVLHIGEAQFDDIPDGIDCVTAETNGTLLRITVENTALSLSEGFVIASHCGATFTEGGS